MPVNTAALKTFAPAMRRQLLEAVGRKLDLLLHSQTPDTLSTYAKQIAELREQETENREQLLERVAYTWFNRLCALRYLDAKGWHQFGCKVLMPAVEGETQPELLKLMRAGNLPADLQSHTDQDRLHGLLDGQIQTAIAGADPQGEVYRQLVLAVCRCYHELLPNLFEGLDDASELLLPDDVLSDGSIVGAFRKEINDDDCQDVESLGWLYQFYIAEKKDEVMARKKAVPTEDIPAVTQLFTPHWIVRYLVENSLGRLWLLNRPGSKLRDHMPYYIEGDAETDFLVINKPEEIKLLDPACGSGHMLTYAFDLLVLIYEEEGYSPNEIPGLILKNNLHGLEICPRAAQLAELALVFKARGQSRRFFQPEQLVRPQIIELQDVQFAEGELNDYIEALDLGELFDPNLFKLLRQFEEAKNFGSLIQPCLDERAIAEVRRAIEAKVIGGQLFLRETHLKVLRVLEQAESLTQRNQVVVANPPDMGGSTMNKGLATFARKHYANGKSDLMTMCLERAFEISQSRALIAFITLDSWLFLSSFENLRKEITSAGRITNLLHIGWNCFPHGHLYNRGVAFVFKNSAKPLRGRFVNLSDVPATVDKETLFLSRNASKECHFEIDQAEFSTLPGCVYAYGISKRVHELLTGGNLASFGDAKRGLQPGDVVAMVRSWWEISNHRMETKASTRSEALQSKMRWFKFDNGGPVRKWYGNNTNVVDWENNGHRIKSGANPIVPSEHLYFQSGFVWSRLTSSSPSFRFHDGGSINGDISPCFFPHNSNAWILALLNSICSRYLLAAFSPTLTFLVSDVLKLPSCEEPEGVTEIVEDAITLSRADWNNLETSWDFRDQPLLRREVRGASLEASWRNWVAQSTVAVRRMRELETKNNSLFIAAYGLGDELRPEVPEAHITLFCNPANRYRKNSKTKKVTEEDAGESEYSNISEEELCYPQEQRLRMFRDDTVMEFLSYAVGCMMGRYSPDHPGLILANTGDTLREFLEKVGKPLVELTFAPDEDGIIPMLDGEWFEDDIVARTREFLTITFPESSVTENLRFIEESLGKDIRKYFCSEFYKDHLQTYKKRPIYWMVQSPKKGFACLIYLHRYTKDTLNQVLNNYFRPYLQKLEARLVQLGLDQLNDDLPARERTAARKEAEKITKVLKECQAWEQDALLPLAQQRIELDLDDGVKVNYLKLQDLLAPIPGLAAKE